MQKYGFCQLTCLAVRSQASDKSEMVSQLLFGETYEIIDVYKNWKLIRSSLDGYEGFIDEKQVMSITPGDFENLKNAPDRFPENAISRVKEKHGQPVLIMPASSLGGFSNGLLQIGNREFRFDGILSALATEPLEKMIPDAANLFINAPYLWGGRTLAGIDCSGLVQNVFKMNGILLPRDAVDQSKQGETLNLVSEALPGDLAFFDNEEREIIHVGIVADHGKIIHASGFVRMDDLDHNGIYNRQRGAYTHKLRLIKRVTGHGNKE
jgi:gamma-D-glutamyl-L-lysine dipeptidyl-peptidase